MQAGRALGKSLWSPSEIRREHVQRRRVPAWHLPAAMEPAGDRQERRPSAGRSDHAGAAAMEPAVGTAGTLVPAFAPRMLLSPPQWRAAIDRRERDCGQ